MGGGPKLLAASAGCTLQCAKYLSQILEIIALVNEGLYGNCPIALLYYSFETCETEKTL